MQKCISSVAEWSEDSIEFSSNPEELFGVIWQKIPN